MVILGKLGFGTPSFTSTPRAGALYPDFAGVEKRTLFGAQRPLLVWLPGGSPPRLRPRHPGPGTGTGPRREGLM